MSATQPIQTTRTEIGPVGQDDPAAELARLAAELTTRGFEAGLDFPPDRRPRLNVRNPRASILAETVYAGDGKYWWSWREPIAGYAEVAAAADILGRVLRAVGE